MPPVLIPLLRHTEARQQQQWGKVAAAAENRKTNNLYPAYLFMPVAVMTFGPFGLKSLAFVKELGRRIHQETGEEMAISYLMQCLSMAIQRGNVAAVLG